MPPKQKYSAESVVEACRSIIINKGAEALTAREISAVLGSTTAPIFTYFGSMEEVIKAVFEKISSECYQYLMECLEYSLSIKEFSIRWVRYARDNTKLYEFLFLQKGMTKNLVNENSQRFAETLVPLVENICRAFDLKVEDAAELMHMVTLVLSGICNSIISKYHSYSDDEVETIVRNMVSSMVNNYYLNYGKIDVDKANAIFGDKVRESMKKYFE
ncbi:MAG: TetR/AcrR family transcriptional regulator [Saccharofermentans sp.]|nr:TetR/AcrR family transcriptional regulator [Saccharofermentans sp.]